MLLADLQDNSIKPQQLIQNAAARLIFNEPKKTRVTSVHQFALATSAGRYDQKCISRYFSKFYRSMTVFIFFMHNRVLTTFSTDWESKNWLAMSYFTVMMSEYCRKAPY